MDKGNKTIIVLQVALAVSLLANGFAFGVMRKGGKPFHAPPPPSDPASRFFDAADQLSPDSRTKVKAILSEKLQGRDKKMDSGKKTFEALRAVAVSPDSTLEDLDKALTDMSAMHRNMGQEIDGTIRAIFQSLPNAQERKTFFEAAFPTPDHKGPHLGFDKKAFDQGKAPKQCHDKDRPPMMDGPKGNPMQGEAMQARPMKDCPMKGDQMMPPHQKMDGKTMPEGEKKPDMTRQDSESQPSNDTEGQGAGL